MPSTARVAALLLLAACASPPPPPQKVGTPDNVDESKLEWQEANLTNFESYPTSQEECEDFSGCKYVGRFAALEDQKSEEWVRENNIAAVHSDHFHEYRLKTLRLRDENGNVIDATVYDTCSDNDCDGCCSRNSEETGFLIDLERHTAERFGMHHGIVEWACLDC